MAVKPAVDAPPSIVTDAGTRTAMGSLLDNVTITPPAGAAVVSDTIPCGCAWLSTSDSLSEMPDSARPAGGCSPGLGDGDGAGDGAGAGDSAGFPLGAVGVAEPPAQAVSEITKPATRTDGTPRNKHRM